MPMTLNGTGSIAGISAGGVPAGAAAPLQSLVRVNTASFASTNTHIRRFANVVSNQGTDITYADSATLGATFTINTAGIYAIGYTESFDAAINFGVSINNATGGVLSLPSADRLCASSTAGAGYVAHVSSTLYLPAGTVLRAHGTNTASTTPSGVQQFTIARIA